MINVPGTVLKWEINEQVTLGTVFRRRNLELTTYIPLPWLTSVSDPRIHIVKNQFRIDIKK